MTEPISKKSGSKFRRDKEQKIKLQQEVLNKTKRLDCFFKETAPQNRDFLASIENLQCNDTLQSNSINNDEHPTTFEVDSDLATQAVLNYRSIDDDPSKWLVKDPVFVDSMIRNPIIQETNLDFSKSKRSYNGVHRYCSHKLLFKILINGEKVRRSWIFYSESLGKIFCIYCTLFSERRLGLFTDGFDDWKHASLISTHESSTTHFEAARVYFKRSSEMKNLESMMITNMVAETNYWKEILKRIVSVVRFLASRAMPFLGSNQKVGNNKNGNFLGLLELIAEFDALLHSHIEKYANQGKGSVSYLSYNIATEFIHILAVEVRATVKRLIEQSKYFSLIVDSTPDISHIDQLTIVIRYVEVTGLAVERFMVFLANTGHKGKEMELGVVEFLEQEKIQIMDCRGQAYDNASNMSGKYKGLQTRIKEINPLAKYIPCSGHTLNLNVSHAAEASDIAVRFFLFVQNVYVFFSASTNRWAILVEQLTSDLRKRNQKNERLLVPKRLSDTRWSARSDALRALKAGYKSFISALTGISTDPNEKNITRIEAESLCNEFMKLETAILVIVWSCILARVNRTSRSLQDPSIDIQTLISLQRSLITYIENLRNENSFSDFEDKAKSLLRDSCSEENLELIYNQSGKRTRKRNTKFDIGSCPDTVFDDRSNFRIKFFYVTLDAILIDLRLKTNSYEENMKPFIFLTNLENLTSDEIRTEARILKEEYDSDLDDGFGNECVQFKYFLEDASEEIKKYFQNMPELEKDDEDDDGEDDETHDTTNKKKYSKSSLLLQYIKKNKIEATFPNVEVALRILESKAVCNASGERSFSSLKRVKGPQRSTMTETHLNDLAMLFINNDILNDINTDQIISKFAATKARKISRTHMESFQM